jgi:predicted GIY-YIG superfamily endonuclease
MRIDNKNKASIYRIINKLNGKFYIGSSSSLTNRLNRHYYSSKYQEKSSIKLLVSAFKNTE